MDIHPNPRIGRDWMLPGQQKPVLTPGQHRKRYLAGALSRDGRTLVVVDSDRKNSDLLLAGGDHALSVKAKDEMRFPRAYLAGGPRLRVVGLYSPPMSAKRSLSLSRQGDVVARNEVLR